MSQAPLFSIIIPIYNTEKELPRCVDSVLAQRFEDFELLLVDDGSKDGSGAICDAYAAKDPRVICVHQANAGCSEARNTGVRKAKGKYLLFLDSDDMWDDANALSELQTIIIHEDPEVVCFGVSIYSEDGRLEKKRLPVVPSNIKGKHELVEHLTRTNQYFSTSYVKALKKDFFVRNDLFFVKGLLSEDIEWSARILVLCKTLSVYSNAFYKRIRRASGSITSSIGEKNITDILGSIEKGVVFARDHCENEDMLRLYYEYWAYQYAMLLGLASTLRHTDSYPAICSRIKKLKWLLKYDHEKKVRAVHLCSSILGLRATMNLMRIYYRM